MALNAPAVAGHALGGAGAVLICLHIPRESTTVRVSGTGMDEFEIFGKAVIQYGEWADAAKQNGDLAEHRARLEAIVVWIEQQKRIAPPENRRYLALRLADLRRGIARLPKPKQAVALPDLSRLQVDVRAQLRQEGEKAVASVRSVIRDAPPEVAEHLAYCLAATKGITIPGEAPDYDHWFAFIFLGLGAALKTRDESLFTQQITGIKLWCKSALLNPGFTREELVRHVQHLIPE
jgi:hypothetical protein